MTDARDAFAARLHGREYRNELTRADETEAKDARLLVVFGASDDLTEFRGIIHNEAGAYEGAGHSVIVNGGRWTLSEPDDVEYARRYARKEKPKKGTRIAAKWCPEGFEGSWLIVPSVPHATFDIMEDGELYCRGAVIDEADLLPKQRFVASELNTVDPSVFIAKFTEPLSQDDVRSLNEYLREWTR